jgi:hypothetical protein
MQVKFSVNGLDEAGRKLDDLERRARGLNGSHKIGTAELFPPDFMAAHSDFSTFAEMLAASDFKIETTADFEAIPHDDWDAYVAHVTRFPDWQAMKTEGAKEWAQRQLGI